MQAWSRPGARESLLALQDNHGLNVPLILWALWLDAERRDGDVTAAVDLARLWSPAVDPLRAARRALKTEAAPIEDAGRLALRRRVQALELEAERLLINALETVAHDAPAAEPLLPRVLRAWLC